MGKSASYTCHPMAEQLSSGWTTIQTVENQPQNIQNAFTQAEQPYPNDRVRAVEQGPSRMIDMLS